jgi:hypothetical protein
LSLIINFEIEFEVKIILGIIGAKERAFKGLFHNK